MEDNYFDNFLASKWNQELLKQLLDYDAEWHKAQQEREEYRAVFIDLVDLEDAIDSAGSHEWPRSTRRRPGYSRSGITSIRPSVYNELTAQTFNDPLAELATITARDPVRPSVYNVGNLVWEPLSNHYGFDF